MRLAVLTCMLLLGTSSGCTSVYYAGMERMGIPKRDILQRRVTRARDAQEDVKKQFSSALDRFRATVEVKGGELEARYDRLNAELERSEQRADTLEKRIDQLEDVAEALFDEWQGELSQYRRDDLRRASERRLRETRRRYDPMMAAMRRAHAKVHPVLDAFRDVVLALKHQLNARAVESFRGEVAGIEREVDALIRAMNASISAAGTFLQSLQQADSPAARAAQQRVQSVAVRALGLPAPSTPPARASSQARGQRLPSLQRAEASPKATSRPQSSIASSTDTPRHATQARAPLRARKAAHMPPIQVGMSTTKAAA